MHNSNDNSLFFPQSALHRPRIGGTDFSTKLRTQNLVHKAWICFLVEHPRPHFNVANNSRAQEFCPPKKSKNTFLQQNKKVPYDYKPTKQPRVAMQSWSGTDILFTCLSFH